MNKFIKVEIAENYRLQIVGGNGGGNASEDGPITELGTITNEGDG